MIVSFHPRVQGDINLRFIHKAELTEEQRDRIARAGGVVLTQSVKAHQYNACRDCCTHLFPNYDFRFEYEGKYGNIALFRKFRAPHPETLCYPSVEAFKNRHFKGGEPLFSFPFVLKGDLGGGGWAVFLVKNDDELHDRLGILADRRRHITRRFIAQSFVDHGGRDLRVVVIGHLTRAYWRCQSNPGEFRNNVGRGATINYHMDPDLIKKGVTCVREFCNQTGINLAAFDVLFDRNQRDPNPLLSEINFLFGRKGLGGSGRFFQLLNEAVRHWAKGL